MVNFDYSFTDNWNVKLNITAVLNVVAKLLVQTFFEHNLCYCNFIQLIHLMSVEDQVIICTQVDKNIFSEKVGGI